MVQRYNILGRYTNQHPCLCSHAWSVEVSHGKIQVRLYYRCYCTIALLLFIILPLTRFVEKLSLFPLHVQIWCLFNGMSLLVLLPSLPPKWTFGELGFPERKSELSGKPVWYSIIIVIWASSL